MFEEERKRVVDEAMSWIGTPYRNGADVKGSGVDCGMLLVRVFVDTQMTEPFDPRPYPSQWHLHQYAERYLSFIYTFGIQVKSPEMGREVLPGDVVMFKYGKCYAHGAIVTKWPVIIHSMGPRLVSRADIPSDPLLRKLPKLYFTVKKWAIEEDLMPIELAYKPDFTTNTALP